MDSLEPGGSWVEVGSCLSRGKYITVHKKKTVTLGSMFVEDGNLWKNIIPYISLSSISFLALVALIDNGSCSNYQLIQVSHPGVVV